MPTTHITPGRIAAIIVTIAFHAIVIFLVIWGPVRRYLVVHEAPVTVNLLAPVAKAQMETEHPKAAPHRVAEVALASLPQIQVSTPPMVVIETPPMILPATSEASANEAPSPKLEPLVRPAAAAADYASLLAQRLERVRRYPAAAMTERQEGVILLFFQLHRSGRLLAWHIARSSTHAALDAEVAEMVQSAAPFPPFPKEMIQEEESFLVPIEFSLERQHIAH